MIDVAIDARITRRLSAGMRAYVHALLDGLPRVAPDIRVHPVGVGGNFGYAEQIALPREINRLAPALTHYPTIFTPLVRRKPYLAMVHDLIHLQYPQFFGPATAAHYAVLATPMLRDAELLLVSDPRTVEACERLLGVPRAHCRVVPLGYDPALLAPTEPLAAPRPFVFYAGNHRPHKNLRTLYEAWAALPAALELDLVLTGADEPAIRATVRRGTGIVRFVGELSPTELAQHYRAAVAYVHPALVEGFGLPMLEAAVLGTPVVASSGSVPMVVAPYAATFAAHDATALRALLADVVANPVPYRRRAAEGSSALRAYTWDKFAAGTAAVYREVVNDAVRS